jgi:hypothetical protein
MAPNALIATASAAFQPNSDIMKPMPQLQVSATISTGGAAKGVSVPPIEILTNSTPSVAYCRRAEMPRAKMRSASISAASVIAAGSVTNEPSSGTSARTTR